jgi:DedD protein
MPRRDSSTKKRMKSAAMATPKPPSEPKAAAKTETKTDEATPSKAEVARKASEPPETAAPASKAGKFAVQAAAPASEKAARELVERLKKGGFTTYTEVVETKDGVRHRVRIGPYATREDAEKARARLKAQGINGNLVAL